MGRVVGKGGKSLRVMHAVTNSQVEREVAYEEALAAHYRLRAAEEDYEVAVMEAHAKGVPNTRLAKAFGVTETAVRTFIKRRKEH